MKRRFYTKQLVQSALIGALYAVVTMICAPISFSLIQVRISEALTVLPYVTPVGVPGLFVGCLAANFICGAPLYDVVFGSLATLIGALATARIGMLKKRNIGVCALGCLPPVVANGLIIGAVIAFSTTPDAFWQGMGLFGAQVAVGEAAVMYLLGLPLLLCFPKKVLGKMRTMCGMD